VAGDGTAGFSGDGASAKLAQLDLPIDIAFDDVQNLLIADYWNNRVRLVEGVAAFVPDYQPDNAIGPKMSRLRGDDRYEGGAGQKYREGMRKGRRAKIFYLVENDGNTDDQFRITANRGNRKRFKTTWKSGGGNVTAQMLAAGYVTPTVAEGDSVLVLGKVKRKKDRGGTTYALRSTSVSDGEQFDQARATVKAKIKGKKKKKKKKKRRKKR